MVSFILFFFFNQVFHTYIYIYIYFFFFFFIKKIKIIKIFLYPWPTPTHVWPFFIWKDWKYQLSTSLCLLDSTTLFLSSSTLLYFPPYTVAHTSSRNPLLLNFSSNLLPANWKVLRVNFSQFQPKPTPLSL